MSGLTVRLRRLDYDPRRGPVGEVFGRFEWGGGVGQSRDVWLPADVFTALSTQLDLVATDRLDLLIAAAAACQTCGQEHEYRRIDDGQTIALLHGQLQPVRRYTWASPTDGHEYRPPQDLTVEWMRQWAAANPEPATAPEPS